MPINKKESLQILEAEIEEIADTLCLAVDGNFDFRITANSDHDSIQKLAMLINFVLDSARRSLSEVKEKNNKLAKIDQLKSDFISNITHELRTPLTLILAPIESILHNKQNKYTKDESQNFEIIYNNCLRLLALVNNLLDISKVESGKYKIKKEAVEIVEYFESLVGDLQKSAEKNTINLSLTCLCEKQVILIDSYLLERILINLLSNAIKFTNVNGEINISLSFKDDYMIFEISDTGIGIAENKVSQLFNRFEQGDSGPSRRYSGTGIGLALVKEYTELLGGEVNVASQLGKGSVFTIKLPLVKFDSTSDRIEQRPTTSSDTIFRNSVSSILNESINEISDADRDSLEISDHMDTIIIAEDNAELRSYYRKELSSLYNLVIVANGQEALDVLDKYPACAILSDVMMSVLDGIEMTKIIKANKELSHISVILVTAIADNNQMVHGLECGADDYLVKPFSLNELKARISSAVRMSKAFIELKKAHKDINELAYYDGLTKLPNRNYFYTKSESILAKNLTNGQSLAFMYLDLDNFKHINDALGHKAGDDLLCKVTHKLQGLLKAIKLGTYHDSGDLELIRVGGDEFIVLLNGIFDNQSIREIAERVIRTVNQDYLIQGKVISVTASLGISLYPTDGENFDTLLRNADAAMYSAKAKGKNKYQFYNDQVEHATQKRLSFDVELRKAFDNDQFSLYYQPIYRVTDQSIVGFEALLRWNHPKNGVVHPTEFIDIAEELGIIVPIGIWAIHTACKQLKQLHELGYKDYTISVSLSMLQFCPPNLIDVIKEALDKNDLDSKYLELELTERMIMIDHNYSLNMLEKLNDMGISISLDDFGTGYCSLNQLNKLPVKTVKIDKSFISSIQKDKESPVLDSMITMSHNLGHKVIAEGIETDTAYQYLRNKGCDQVQGYLFSKPVEFKEILKLIQK